MGAFDKKKPDGESPDGPDPPLYPKKKEPPPVTEEELKGLQKPRKLR